MAFISQNNVDGQYETWIDGVTIRGKDYDKVERIASEVALHRAWKTRVEESLDQHERQPPGWGGPEIAVWCLLCMVACIVVSAGINIGWWLWNG